MAKVKKFGIVEALKFGWETTKANLGFFLGLSAIILVLFFIPPIIFFLVQKKTAVLDTLTGRALTATIMTGFGIIQAVVGIGLFKIMIGCYDNKKGKIADLFSNWYLFFDYQLGGLLFGLVVGSILFISGIIAGIMIPMPIPEIGKTIILSVGFVIALFVFFLLVTKFGKCLYFIIDQETGPIESLKRSSTITKGSKWDLFVLEIVCFFIINLLGALCLGVGLLVTIPVTFLAGVFAYRKLLEQVELPEPPVKNRKAILAFGLVWFLICTGGNAANMLKPPAVPLDTNIEELSSEQIIVRIDIYKELLEEDPYNMDAWLELGNTYYFNKNFTDAIASYQEITKQATKMEKVYRNSGKNPKDFYKNMPGKNPVEEAYRNLGNIHYDIDMPKQAINYYQEALKMNPMLSDTRVNLAILHHKTGHLKEAIEVLHLVTEIDPDYDLAYLNLGFFLHENKKDPAKAKAAWEKYLELKPNSPYSEDIRQKIAAIDKA